MFDQWSASSAGDHDGSPAIGRAASEDDKGRTSDQATAGEGADAEAEVTGAGREPGEAAETTVVGAATQESELCEDAADARSSAPEDAAPDDADAKYSEAASDVRAKATAEAAARAHAEAALEAFEAMLAAGIEALRDCDPAALIAALGKKEPGLLAGSVLQALDLSRLANRELLDVLTASGAQLAHAEAAQITTMAAFAARRRTDCEAGGPDAALRLTPEQVSEWAADEIATQLHLTRTNARIRMEQALDLSGRLPATFAALRTGRIDAHRARVIAEGTHTLDDEQSAAVEARVLPRAERQSPPRLRDSVKRAVLRLDPDAANKRHEKAVAERGVQMHPLEDGMAELVWTDRADHVVGFAKALDALARLAKHGERGDGRNIQQCRADVMADLAARLLDLDGLPTEHGHRPQVSVVIPLGTALRISEETAELVGYGPIPAELAHELAADASWQRLLTDPATGALLDVGRDKYRPPAALREHVLARDPYCVGPGCRVPARRCDLDHRIDWAHGGHTRANDLDPLCRTHHRLKHEGGWRRERRPDGSTLWKTPSGHEHIRDPYLLPGAKPPLGIDELSPDHQQAIRHHARTLGIALPADKERATAREEHISTLGATPPGTEEVLSSEAATSGIAQDTCCAGTPDFQQHCDLEIAEDDPPF